MWAISAKNDTMIVKIISEAMEKVGKDGVITVEEAKGMETSLEVVEGMQFDRGYLSPYFVTDSARMEVVLDDCYILIHEKKISSMRDLLPVLEQIAKTGKPLMIIAEDIESEALAMLVVNRLKGVLNVCAVKAPGFGDRRKAMLQDIAILTGGPCISEDLGIKLERVTGDQPGPSGGQTPVPLKLQHEALGILDDVRSRGEVEGARRVAAVVVGEHVEARRVQVEAHVRGVQVAYRAVYLVLGAGRFRLDSGRDNIAVGVELTADLDDLRHGEDDLQDCIYGRRYLEGLDWVDGDRVGIMGGSYGGFMVLAAQAFRPGEFACGVDIYGVANWIRTQQEFPPWWSAFVETLWADIGHPVEDEAYLRSSPPLVAAEERPAPLLAALCPGGP